MRVQAKLDPEDVHSSSLKSTNLAPQPKEEAPPPAPDGHGETFFLFSTLFSRPPASAVGDRRDCCPAAR